MSSIDLTNEMQTHCVGRFLIDLPKDFDAMKVAGVETSFSPSGVDFQTAPKMQIELFETNSSRDQFIRAVQTRVTALKNSKHLSRKEQSLFTFSQNISDTKILIRRQEADAPEGGYFFSEIHLLIDKFHVIVTAESFKNKFSAAEKWLAEFADSISPFIAGTASNGFCVGPLVIAGKYDREIVDFAFRSKKYLDVLISIDIDSYSQAEEMTLLQRANDPQNLLKIFDVNHSILRKAELKVAGMTAQEVLLGLKSLDQDGKSIKQHKLMLETMPSKRSTAQPGLTVRVVTGQQDANGQSYTSSISDFEVIAIWDAIVKSIRFRPGAV